MKGKDTFDAIVSLIAVIADALAIYLGALLAVWLRFHSGWIPFYHEELPPMRIYYYGAGVMTLLFVLIFRNVGLYKRPQMGTFIDKIPKLVRANSWGVFLSIALAFIIRTEQPFSRISVMVAFFTILFLLLLERYAMFRIELHMIRHHKRATNVLIVGTDSMALRLQAALNAEKHMKTDVLGFVAMDEHSDHTGIPSSQIIGLLADLVPLLDRCNADMVVIADTSIHRDILVQIMNECERRLIDIRLVPDIFRVLTSGVVVETFHGIPVIGVSKWPLDYFWNRMRKRAEDIVGALIGLLFAVPIVLVSAIVIKKQSPGPIFFKQIRCGENGKTFALYKIRTMRVDAESVSGPVWTKPDDDRCFPAGQLMRRFNVDEVPQFWNVLKGDMSLVGPRPERPHFVEQFKEDLGQYMWRHRSKPGMTGWAQVNGLRGQSSLTDRLKYDLYYLEKWSFSLDFKILIRTFFATENAY